MKADDLVIAVLALNKRYEDAITGGGISDSELTRIILEKYPHQVLEEARIRPHHMHGDSEALDRGIYSLRMRRIIKHWVPENYYTWDFPLTPAEYFEKNIKPELTEEKVRQLEEFASSIN